MLFVPLLGLLIFTVMPMGFITSPLPFLTDANWARVTVIVANMWIGIPYTMLIATGILTNIPAYLYESARIDGASPFKMFTKITIPISKPIIIYTILTSFIAPWADYIFASVILGDKSDRYTIAMGLYGMLTQDNIDKYFKQFAAGAVLISIPIAALFISLQKYYVEGLSGSVKG
ncbi:Binding-protein-dependent transport system inner membrane component [Pseudobutyrivibrio sp. ACV-2]|uniref:ABC transporter permease subunit n=1 Tax=Pseudobutyrivibrio sp. ACV-2 TaxID=1520801 RepID=UPI000898278B|nr:ABC transporter permease subunit [Pseudobutyrivibrio sp. ACV-2]SDZ84495.1 Binding-protein-dependent transport system inner membrane component [Pseudobutyrivibrio sp. ACV-2]